MLESPDYFFRVREIGRLRQTRQRASKTTAMPVVELVQSPWYAPTLHRWLMF